MKLKSFTQPSNNIEYIHRDKDCGYVYDDDDVLVNTDGREDVKNCFWMDINNTDYTIHFMEAQFVNNKKPNGRQSRDNKIISYFQFYTWNCLIVLNCCVYYVW